MICFYQFADCRYLRLMMTMMMMMMTIKSKPPMVAPIIILMSAPETDMKNLVEVMGRGVQNGVKGKTPRFPPKFQS